MVSNNSSIAEDFGSLVDSAKQQGKELGQAVGLVDEDVIPGDPAAATALGTHLAKLGAAAEKAGQGFKKIDLGGWHGAAAEGFQGYLHTAPNGWLKAADAFEAAGKAVQEYGRVLGEMKPRAEQAKQDLEKANAQSEAAAKNYNKAADSFNAQVKSGGSPAPMAPFRDPGAEAAAHAEQVIKQAKAAVREAGDRAAQAVRAAEQDAPASPGRMAELMDMLSSAAEAAGGMAGDLAGGAFEAVTGLVKLARQVNFMDPYNLTHPAKMTENAGTLIMGVGQVVKNPYAGVKTIVDVDGWKNNPAKSLGSMVPDAIASLAGGAGAAEKVARGVEKAGGAATKLGKHFEDIGKIGKHVDDAPGKFHDPFNPHEPPWTKPGWEPPAQQPGPHHEPWNQSPEPHTPKPGEPHSPEPHSHEPEPKPDHAPGREPHSPEPAPDPFNPHDPAWDDLDDLPHEPHSPEHPPYVPNLAEEAAALDKHIAEVEQRLKKNPGDPMLRQNLDDLVKRRSNLTI